MRLTTSLALLLAALAITACGSDDPETDAPSDAAAPAEQGAFPVTIEHKYGSTTIERAPERVVVVGLREQDPLLALGIVPVATTEWFGDHPGAIFPWAKDELGDAAVPTVLTSEDGIEIEKVAAQRPDLIVGVYAGITKKEYEALSKIAPVVAQPKGKPDYGTSWQEETTTVGRAVGKSEEAERQVAGTEQLIADAKADHPEFAGKSAAMVTDYEGVFAYGPDDIRTRLLDELGFVYPPALAGAFPNEFGGQLSDERLDAIDTDVLVWLADGDRTPAQLKKDPLYSKLDVAKEDRDVFILADDRVYEATSFVSVLSMPTLMEELVPRLAAAVDGDPATPTAQDG